MYKRQKHRHKQGLEEFSENMESIFQYYKQKLRDIGKLCDIRIRYPVNALSEVMKKQSFGKKLIAETVERFKTNFGEQPCSACLLYTSYPWAEGMPFSKDGLFGASGCPTYETGKSGGACAGVV